MRAILVLNEMPKNCLDNCPCEFDCRYCKVAEKRFEMTFADEDVPRPDWCSLRPLPEKMLTWHDDEQDDYEMGWNACIDAIIGDEKE